MPPPDEHTSAWMLRFGETQPGSLFSPAGGVGTGFSRIGGPVTGDGLDWMKRFVAPPLFPSLVLDDHGLFGGTPELGWATGLSGDERVRFADKYISKLMSDLFPGTSNIGRLAPIVIKVCLKYDINTPKRLAAFLAQVGHESGGFSRFTENLNYSAARLVEVFPKYFKDEAAAKDYARKPEKIANRVYGNRMKNGDEKSGDGWKYRGRGALQVTGKENVEKYATYLGLSVDETIAYLETDEGAVMSAGWYWDTHDINSAVDKGNFTQVTKIINGGTNGLNDRLSKYKKALKLMGVVEKKKAQPKLPAKKSKVVAPAAKK